MRLLSTTYLLAQALEGSSAGDCPEMTLASKGRLPSVCASAPLQFAFLGLTTERQQLGPAAAALAAGIGPSQEIGASPTACPFGPSHGRKIDPRACPLVATTPASAGR